MIQRCKKIFFYLQPEKSDYNLWNLLIGLTTMLLIHDMENGQRTWKVVDGHRIECSYLEVVLNSSPNSFVATLCLLSPFIPAIYHGFSIPLVLNIIPIICEEFGFLSIGSAIGLAFSAFHIGRGYGGRVTSIVTAISFLLGPIFTCALEATVSSFIGFWIVAIFKWIGESSPVSDDDISKNVYIKTLVVYTVQAVLYYCSRKCPAFFENYAIIVLDHFKIDKEQQKDLLRAARNFEFELEYSKVLMLSNLLQKRIHRRCSEVATSRVRCPTEIDMKTIGEVVTKYFGVSSSIQNCRVTQHIVAPTEKGESIVRFGSPLHRVIELVRELSESGSAWKINVDNFDKDLGGSNVELCLKNGWLKRKKGVKYDYYVIGKQFKSRDIVREVMEGVMMGGGRYTVADLQKHGVLDAMSVE
ncbi:hypothetical protein CRE_24885 [Caenorhabditis remanei]|uniref:Uncharacterized protein n=1 Tax=Caenorhabditis remanei TaxID=31234 RepID=E3NPN1_CAERE|nr:hypothetical protein CRE_24885 [Caenorhabditis remanei]